jgi:glutaminyl-peptide cyclotransferase
MLDLAETLNPLLDARHHRAEAGDEDDEDIADTTLQLVFFDGEEAFKDWTAKDSIYGARHLAEKWANTYVLPTAKRRLLVSQMTELAGIEHFVLLDLLGAPRPLIRSYFADTHWLFDRLAGAESKLRDAGLLMPGRTAVQQPRDSFFMERKANQYLGHVEDDHIPFLHRGVSVLHVISEPFPHVWHTLKVCKLPYLSQLNFHRLSG